MELIDQLKQELTSEFLVGNFSGILEVLKNRIPNQKKKYSKVLQLIKTFKGIEQEKFRGTAYHDQLQVRINRLSEQLLKFIQKLKAKDFFGYTNENGILKYKDGRDGQTYGTIKVFGNEWMLENINFDTGWGCWFYDDDKKNENYGRLYKWSAAQYACPLGFRLPTVEEVDSLINETLDYYGDSSRGKKDREDFFNTFFKNDGGMRNIKGKSKNLYEGLDKYSRYWTCSTREYSKKVFFYHHTRRRGYRTYTNPLGKRKEGMYCRCIKE